MQEEDNSARLEKLERQNRRITLVGGSLLVLLTALLLIAWVSPAPRILEAGGLRIKDSNRGVRLYVGLNDDDEPEIVFYDEAGDHLRTLTGGPGTGASPQPARDWAWPKSKSARMWSLTVWFVRPKKKETQVFHNSRKCIALVRAAQTGEIDSKALTKQKLDYAYKHYADQLEPCTTCCKSLLPP
jgi:hypothetical protein